jgi:predicted MPP superfamily phosphohydrolase
MKFQYFSDIHLEFYTSIGSTLRFDIKPCAPYLILAGDIGIPCYDNYRLFLEYLSPLYEYIFIITGNHEYHYRRGKYTENIDNWMFHIDNTIRGITKQLSNVVFLQNEKFDIPNTEITIYGTTMWSHIKNDEKEHIRTVSSDCTNIPDYTLDASTEMFEVNKYLLELMVRNNPTKQFVIVTHHLPTYKLVNEKYKDSHSNSAFATEMEISNENNVLAWVCGHTHTPCQVEKFYCNPIGYPGENKHIDFNRTFELHTV